MITPRFVLTVALSVALVTGAVAISPAASADTPAGIEWTQQTAPINRNWQAVTYGGGQFVAVANGDTSGQIMTSPDGQSWTSQSVSGGAVYWRSVVYGNGTYVAVGAERPFASTDLAMSSSDGINWTPHTVDVNQWMSVAHGAGVFVAVSKDGTNRIMTSPDGSTWTPAAAPEANEWTGITYAGGQFVAVAQTGTNRVMTSPNGFSWTLQTAASASSWNGITYGDGLYVATAWNGTDRVMTSPDAVTWTAQSVPEAREWLSVTYGDGLFVSVSNDANERVMTSPDGVTWTSRPAASQKRWSSVAFGDGVFVAVALDRTPDDVMSSSAVASPVLDASQWTVVRQALPLPESGDCVDVVDADYAWGTGLSGGWIRGWEPWVVQESGARGGWACWRTLVNTGGTRWILGN